MDIHVTHSEHFPQQKAGATFGKETEWYQQYRLTILTIIKAYQEFLLINLI